MQAAEPTADGWGSWSVKRCRLARTPPTMLRMVPPPRFGEGKGAGWSVSVRAAP